MTGLEQFSLDGKRILVSGGSRGLGRAIALGLSQAGASVVTIARSDIEKCEPLKHVSADLSDLDSTPEIVDRSEMLLDGPIDSVVHAAGIQFRSPVEDFPPTEFERVLKVNLIAPFRLSQEIGRRQISADRTGAHLFIGSLTSTIGLPNVSAYATTKTGIMGVVRSMSLEWAPRGIRVNAVGPGYFRTALTEELFHNESDVRRLQSRIPAGRFGRPEELTGAAIYLLSDASSYVTGQILFVDGGWTAA